VLSVYIIHCNFICSLSDVIIKTFSQSVSKQTDGRTRLNALSPRRRLYSQRE